MALRVRKAVLPVAGLGTRFLPATKAMAKEMLTVVDRPLIQYAIEECLGAGDRGIRLPSPVATRTQSRITSTRRTSWRTRWYGAATRPPS